jgi:photosystem II stability/assembly factor-like uncharacterized protein
VACGNFRTARLRTSLTLVLALATHAATTGIGASASALGPGTITWRSIGPEGGLVESVAVDPTDPDVVYVGTFTNGVFRSDDDGLSWNRTGLTKGARIHSIAVAGDRTIFAVSIGELLFGVLRSRDLGDTWQPVNDGLSGALKVEVDPTDPAVAFVASSDGVYKTIDGGDSWSKSFSKLEILDVAVDPLTPSTVYAITDTEIFKTTDGGESWHPTYEATRLLTGVTVDPVVTSTVYAATISGVVKSVDAGATWQLATSGLPKEIIWDLAVDPARHETVLAATSSDGVYRTMDGGTSWAPASVGIRSRGMQDVTVAPTPTFTMFASTSDGLYRSRNGGDSWILSVHGMVATSIYYQIALDPADTETVYAVVASGGLAKSTDGGSTWRQAGKGLPGGFAEAIAIDPESPSTVYVNTGNGIYKSIDASATWLPVNDGLPRPLYLIGGLVMDPTTPTTLYTLPYWAGVYKTVNGGATWSPANGGIEDLDMGGLAVDPVTPTTLYSVNQSFVYRSIDGGSHWVKIAELIGTSLYDVVVDPNDDDVLYAVALGGMWKSIDGGVSWKELMSFPNADPERIVLPASLPGTVYVAAIGSYEDPSSGGVYASTDGGQSWVRLVRGMTNRDVSSIAIDPVTGLLRYAGTTGSGIYSALGREDSG